MTFVPECTTKRGLVHVTPSAKTDKTHFVIVDAAGVSKSVKADSRQMGTETNCVHEKPFYGDCDGQHN